MIVKWLLLVVIGLPLAATLLFRIVPPPATPLMLIRAAQGDGLTKDWTPLDRISPHLQRAVIASEDGHFCSHWGFDWQALENAVERYGDGGKVVGASTISMQTAKNLFLWPDRTFLRKGLEAYFTLYLEALWPKARILEMYLNIAEFGPGLYGAEAAAQTYFKKPAASLTRFESARLAAILPSPRRYSPTQPTPRLAAHGRIIAQRSLAVSLAKEGVCP